MYLCNHFYTIFRKAVRLNRNNSSLAKTFLPAYFWRFEERKKDWSRYILSWTERIQYKPTTKVFFSNKKFKNTQKSVLNFLSSSSHTLSAWFSVQSNIKRNNLPLPLKTKLSPYLRAAARTKTETKNQPGAQKSKFPKPGSYSSCWETKPLLRCAGVCECSFFYWKGSGLSISIASLFG